MDDRYRNDDRGGYRDREPRNAWQNPNRDNNGYQSRYQPNQRHGYGERSGEPNQDRMGYNDGNRGNYNHNNNQQRSQYRPNHQSYNSQSSYGNRGGYGGGNDDEHDRPQQSPPNANYHEPRQIERKPAPPVEAAPAPVPAPAPVAAAAAAAAPVEDPAAEIVLDKNNYNPPEMETEGLDNAR